MKKHYNNYWYFAHSKLIYDSPGEKKLLNFLESTFHFVVCPHRDMGELGAMKPYLDRVKECFGTVVAEYEGTLGKGAYHEVAYSLKLKKPTLCVRLSVPHSNIILRSVRSVEIVDEESWKKGYAKLTLL